MNTCLLHAGYACLIHLLAKYVFFWLKGVCLNAEASLANVSVPNTLTGSGTDMDDCRAFTGSFEPSSHLVGPLYRCNVALQTCHARDTRWKGFNERLPRMLPRTSTD
jgi:hypothetical protein